MGKAALFFLLTSCLCLMSGCGGSNSTPFSASPVGPSAAVPVTISMTDTPPAGVTILFFQLSVTGATLTPQSGSAVSLLSSTNPIPVNVTQLQTDSVFLGNANVAPATYTSLSLTFANPQLTIYNGSGATIGSGASACANNAVCQLTPSTTPLKLTFSSTPFPIDLTASSPLAFLLDIHMDTVIQPDLSVNLAATNGVTLSQLPTPPSGAPIPRLGHLVGTVQSLTPSTGTPTAFTLQTTFGRTFTIDLNGSTTYNYPSSVCSADNVTCLAAQQVVKVEVSEQTDGTLLASEVDYLQAAGQTVVQGNIINVSTSNGTTLMNLILQNGPNAPSSLPFGRWVAVTVPSSGVTYAVDSGNFTLPSSLSFTQASDLVPGQQVSVVVLPSSVTTGANSGNSSPWSAMASTTFTTNSITLEPSQITGSVSSVSASNLSFTMNTNPGFFIAPTGPNAPPFSVTVQTTAQTTFTNFSPDTIAGVGQNDVVSVQGWLYAMPGSTPTNCSTTPGCANNYAIAAETVINRPGPTPLF